MEELDEITRSTHLTMIMDFWKLLLTYLTRQTQKMIRRGRTTRQPIPATRNELDEARIIDYRYKQGLSCVKLNQSFANLPMVYALVLAV